MVDRPVLGGGFYESSFRRNTMLRRVGRVGSAGAVARAPFGRPGTSCPTKERAYEEGACPSLYCPLTPGLLVGRDVLGLPERQPFQVALAYYSRVLPCPLWEGPNEAVGPYPPL